MRERMRTLGEARAERFAQAPSALAVGLRRGRERGSAGARPGKRRSDNPCVLCVARLLPR